MEAKSEEIIIIIDSHPFFFIGTQINTTRRASLYMMMCTM